MIDWFLCDFLLQDMLTIPMKNSETVDNLNRVRADTAAHVPPKQFSKWKVAGNYSYLLSCHLKSNQKKVSSATNSTTRRKWNRLSRNWTFLTLWQLDFSLSEGNRNNTWDRTEIHARIPSVIEINATKPGYSCREMAIHFLHEEKG